MDQKPPVWPYYLAYVIFMSLLYVGTALIAVIALALQPQGMKEEDMITLMVLPVCSCPFAIAYLAAPFLPRAPWAWIYHLVLIALGLTSLCCMPVTIPLLIFWLKPETKAYFGRE